MDHGVLVVILLRDIMVVMKFIVNEVGESVSNSLSNRTLMTTLV